MSKKSIKEAVTMPISVTATLFQSMVSHFTPLAKMVDELKSSGLVRKDYVDKDTQMHLGKMLYDLDKLIRGSRTNPNKTDNVILNLTERVHDCQFTIAEFQKKYGNDRKRWENDTKAQQAILLLSLYNEKMRIWLAVENDLKELYQFIFDEAWSKDNGIKVKKELTNSNAFTEFFSKHNIVGATEEAVVSSSLAAAT
jgi:hypothetical protein